MRIPNFFLVFFKGTNVIFFKQIKISSPECSLLVKNYIQQDFAVKPKLIQGPGLATHMQPWTLNQQYYGPQTTRQYFQKIFVTFERSEL